jgi:hypothetical protein
MTILTKKRSVLFCMLAMMLPASVWASGGPTEPGERREPPQEAFEACREKNEGDVVEVTTSRGESIKSTCRKNKDQLVAVPEGDSRSPEGDVPSPSEAIGR